ncbi:MAG: isoleucine--tRNA ligase [Myxococcota bacterium]
MSQRSEQHPYPDVDPRPSFPAIEREILDFWERERIFRASVEQRPAGEDGSNEFVFYDGPPFANGLPHYGHLLTGFVKDVIPRYQTLRGRRVERRFGWDCHGLPAEMEAEKELGISGRQRIIEFGIERFNERCRRSVLRYTREWKEYVTRQARWVDFENDYKTMDIAYMESVLWAFKSLWDKGLLYEGDRVMPYSWAAETPLSNFETRLDDAYRERQDPAITVRFELERAPSEDVASDLLVWTTTPWTLPSNLALAVGPAIEYTVFELDGRRVILGEATVSKYASELADARRVGSVRGSELVGRCYRPLLPFFAQTPGCFRVLAADFVDTEEGTGTVHLAPGFGEPDMEVCQAAGIPVVCPVDERGRFTDEVPPYAGQHVFDTNRPIVRGLRERGRLFKHETYVHAYPHCWRTGTPLIYKAMRSWFVRVSAIRERMTELNRGMHWVPEHIRDGLFGNWLEGARDWCISRNRFWGTPIPVWQSDDPAHPRIDVYGSLDELERDFGVRPEDLHRPGIDELVRPNPDDPSGRSRMRRMPEVLDCWFESGSMPFAQVHYPFENREWFEKHFPADFITEYLAQTRGWFYTLMVLATALFDRPPFRNCICHGVVLDENGQKLSKRLRNYPSPEEIFETYGADALRWFLCSSPILRGSDLQIDREGQAIREVVRLVINPIWNAYYFFCLYANSERIRATPRVDSPAVLDRYILAKTRELISEVEGAFDAYDLPAACTSLTAFLDALNNWYIRRSRDRFWGGEEVADRRAAYDTLYSVLITLLRVLSPLLPLISEAIYRGLTGERSVHLSDWPEAASLPGDAALVASMDRTREVCATALSLRRAHGIRVRQPLQRLTVAGFASAALEPFVKLIRDEVNVKEVELDAEIERFARFRLQPNARSLGRRLGKRMQEVLAAAKRGEWRRLEDGRVQLAGETLDPADYELKLEAREGGACQALSTNDAIVLLDLQITPELEQEGRARDLVRVVQQARKEADLHVSDRIHLVLALPDGMRSAAEQFGNYIAGETLARRLELTDEVERAGFFVHHARLGDERIDIALRKLA